MIVSREQNFVFIHVGKTGGTNIARALEPFSHAAEPAWVDRLPLSASRSLNPLLPFRWRRFRRHTTAQAARRQLPRDFFDRAFKFAFVRNPWDWILSRYSFILRHERHHRHETVKRLGSFEDYLEWEIRRSKRFQHTFLTDRRGRFLVDYVGRFENLREDFGRVCEIIGVSTDLQGPDRSKPRDYRSHYTPTTRDLVARHFSRDIELFGYSFGEPPPSGPAFERAGRASARSGT